MNLFISKLCRLEFCVVLEGDLFILGKYRRRYVLSPGPNVYLTDVKSVSTVVKSDEFNYMQVTMEVHKSRGH
jgi:hypothetical protein